MSKRLPDAVQQQAERMETMDAEIASANPGPTPEPEPPAPAPEPAPDPAPLATEDNWQHKYLTLQGIMSSKTADLQSKIDALTAKVTELTAVQKATEPPAPEPKAKLVTDADVDTFGADLIELMRKVAVETDAGAKDSLLAEIADLKAQIPNLTAQIETVTRTSEADRRNAYFVELAKLCPTWKDVNESDAFKGWLVEHDPLSGEVRNDLLQKAFNAFDHDRTGVIFNAYRQETGSAPAPAPARETPPDPAAELAAQVSPNGGKAAAEITPDNGQKTWSSTEVQNFFNDVARGAYRGRQADHQRIDAEIDQALIDGRVKA